MEAFKIPNYHYRCRNTDCQYEHQVYQSIKDSTITLCPQCMNNTLERVLYAAECIISECKTLGSWAEKNRKNLGEAYCQEKQQQWREERLSASEFVGSLPPGATTGPKRIPIDTPWRKASKPVDLSLAKFCPEDGEALSPAAEKYLETGRKS